MAASNTPGVQVQLNKAAEKQRFGPDVSSDSSDGDTTAAAVMWSSRTLWTLFALGWVFPPCSWVAAAAGFRAGNDRQCLIKRKRGLSPAQSAAWWSNVLLTVLSIAALILVTTMLAGIRGAAQEGPFYLTMAGPADAFPNMRDATKMAAVARALHAALNLGNDYESTNIAVWLQAQTTADPVPARHRHMLAAGSDLVAVLGYTLLVTEQLPAKAEIVAMLNDTIVTEAVAQKLADEGFVTEENLGLLSVRVESQAPAMLTTGVANVASESMVPIGRRDCQGMWTPLMECEEFDDYPDRRLLATRTSNDGWIPCGPGTMTGLRDEMFNITVQARAGGVECNITEGTIREAECQQACPAGACLSPPDASALNINTTEDLRLNCYSSWYDGWSCDTVDQNVVCPNGEEGRTDIKCVDGQYIVVGTRCPNSG